MNVLGIDLSVRATGLAMLCEGETRDTLNRINLPGSEYLSCDKREFRYHGALAVRRSTDQLGAWDDILLPLLEWAMHAHQVVIEGYSHGSENSSMHKVLELGGIIRYHLRKIGQVPVQIAPSSLKKYIAGHGFADKVQMLEAVQRMGLPILDHNMADAFGLAKLGLVLQLPDSAYIELDKAERETIHTIKYAKKKPKKRKEPELWEK